MNPDWFISWQIDDNEIGNDGMYHIQTNGCGCCSGCEDLDPDEYTILLEDMIVELKEQLKRVYNRT